MPVQTWTPGQVLTAAEMKTITDMLPFPTVTTVNVSPAVAGNYYRCQPSAGGTITITLPPPTTAGQVVGAKLDATVASGTAVVQHNSSETIYIPVGAGATRGVTSVTLGTPDASILLISDGTNWHALSLDPDFGPLGILPSGVAIVTANQGPTAPPFDLTGATVTVLVGSGRRIRLTGQVSALASSVTSDQVALAIFEGATQLCTCNGNLTAGGSSVAIHTEAILQPSAGSHTYKLTAQRSAGTGNLTNNAAATYPTFLLAEDIGGN